MARFLLICLAGAVGTGARYLLSGWLLRLAGPGFPYGTLAVNVIGSFLIGLVMQISLSTELIPPTLRLTLTTGLMGGFTTYSAFNYETLQLVQEGSWPLAAANLGIIVVSCLAAGVLGVLAGRIAAGG